MLSATKELLFHQHFSLRKLQLTKICHPERREAHAERSRGTLCATTALFYVTLLIPETMPNRTPRAKARTNLEHHALCPSSTERKRAYPDLLTGNRAPSFRIAT